MIWSKEGRAVESVNEDINRVTSFFYNIGFHWVEPWQSRREPNIELFNALNDQNEVRGGRAEIELSFSDDKKRHTTKCIGLAPSETGSLTVIANLLAASDDSYTETSYNIMLREWKLLCDRNLNVRAALSYKRASMKCPVFVLDTGPEKHFTKNF